MLSTARGTSATCSTSAASIATPRTCRPRSSRAPSAPSPRPRTGPTGTAMSPPHPGLRGGGPPQPHHPRGRQQGPHARRQAAEAPRPSPSSGARLLRGGWGLPHHAHKVFDARSNFDAQPVCSPITGHLSGRATCCVNMLISINCSRSYTNITPLPPRGTGFATGTCCFMLNQHPSCQG
jgi:hypothetical protein